MKNDGAPSDKSASCDRWPRRPRSKPKRKPLALALALLCAGMESERPTFDRRLPVRFESPPNEPQTPAPAKKG